MAGRRAGVSRCRVTSVSRPTPHLARVEIVSDDLVGVAPAGPDQRVKVAFPEGRVFGDDPAEMSRSRRRRRTYTLLDLDPERGTAAVEFVLHGSGLASEWAAGAQPGDEVALTTPVGRFELPDSCAELVLVSDESGLPALRAIAAGLPEGLAARAYVEVADDAERADIPSPAALDVTWLVRATGATIGDLVGELTCADDGFVWIAGESDAVRDLRTHLITDAGLHRSRITAVAYWQRGRAEGDPAAGRPGEHTEKG